jgi:hypothetical protein
MSTGEEREASIAADLAEEAVDATAKIGVPINEKTAAEVIEHGVDITAPPEYETFTFLSEGGQRSSITVHFRWGRLIAAIANGVITGAAVVQMPWLAVFAAIAVLLSLKETTTTYNLKEREASVLWTLWRKRDPGNNTVEKDGLLAAVNAERAKYNHSAISQDKLDHALDCLKELGMIEQSKHYKSRWFLSESIQIRY